MRRDRYEKPEEHDTIRYAKQPTCNAHCPERSADAYENDDRMTDAPTGVSQKLVQMTGIGPADAFASRESADDHAQRVDDRQSTDPESRGGREVVSATLGQGN